jgi:hypothetical protein
MWSRSESVYASHLACGRPDGASLAICPTCHLVQPCLNGMVLALSTSLPPFRTLSVEDHRKLIVGCPGLIPLLLPIAAILAEASQIGADDEQPGSRQAACARLSD